MSLSPEQIENTKIELNENFIKSKLSISEIASDLGTSTNYIEDLFNLNPARLEDTWILRNYLIEKVEGLGLTPTPFSALVGDWHDYWFLNGEYIDNGKIL